MIGDQAAHEGLCVGQEGGVVAVGREDDGGPQPVLRRPRDLLLGEGLVGLATLREEDRGRVDAERAAIYGCLSYRGVVRVGGERVERGAGTVRGEDRRQSRDAGGARSVDVGVPLVREAWRREVAIDVGAVRVQAVVQADDLPPAGKETGGDIVNPQLDLARTCAAHGGGDCRKLAGIVGSRHRIGMHVEAGDAGGAQQRGVGGRCQVVEAVDASDEDMGCLRSSPGHHHRLSREGGRLKARG